MTPPGPLQGPLGGTRAHPRARSGCRPRRCRSGKSPHHYAEGRRLGAAWQALRLKSRPTLRRAAPQRNAPPQVRRRGRRFRARATGNGSRQRVGEIRSRCSRTRPRAASRSWCRSATGGCWPRRSRSFAAPRRSWRWTSRRPPSPGCASRHAAMPTSRTSVSSPHRIAVWCWTSTTSTRPFRGPGSGTSSVSRRASRSPGATATSPRRRPALRSSARSAPTVRRCASSPRCGTSTSGTRASTSTPSSPTWPTSPTASR